MNPCVLLSLLHDEEHGTGKLTARASRNRLLPLPLQVDGGFPCSRSRAEQLSCSRPLPQRYVTAAL